MLFHLDAQGSCNAEHMIIEINASMDQPYSACVFLLYLLYTAEWYGEQKGIQTVLNSFLFRAL